MNLAKEIVNLYNENFKTLEKEIEEDTGRWQEIPLPTMVMDWKNQYYENESPIKGNIEIPCHLNQDLRDILHRQP